MTFFPSPCVTKRGIPGPIGLESIVSVQDTAGHGEGELVLLRKLSVAVLLLATSIFFPQFVRGGVLLTAQRIDLHDSLLEGYSAWEIDLETDDGSLLQAFDVTLSGTFHQSWFDVDFDGLADRTGNGLVDGRSDSHLILPSNALVVRSPDEDNAGGASSLADSQFATGLGTYLSGVWGVPGSSQTTSTSLAYVVLPDLAWDLTFDLSVATSQGMVKFTPETILSAPDPASSLKNILATAEVVPPPQPPAPPLPLPEVDDPPTDLPQIPPLPTPEPSVPPIDEPSVLPDDLPTPPAEGTLPVDSDEGFERPLNPGEIIEIPIYGWDPEIDLELILFPGIGIWQLVHPDLSVVDWESNDVTDLVWTYFGLPVAFDGTVNLYDTMATTQGEWLVNSSFVNFGNAAWHRSVGSTSAESVVPEPNSLQLLALVLVSSTVHFGSRRTRR